MTLAEFRQHWMFWRKVRRQAAKDLGGNKEVAKHLEKWNKGYRAENKTK